MRTELYWIPGPWPGRLAVAPRPRGGEWLVDEVGEWSRAGIDVVVSLLTPDEVAELDLMREQDICRVAGVEFLSFPVLDRNVPTPTKSASDLIATLSRHVAEGKTVLVHCRQGIGRSALIAASVLIAFGEDAENALKRISTARGCSVPETPEQKAWIMEFAKSATNLNRDKVGTK
jgi:protein-tyrosine phosphatase